MTQAEQNKKAMDAIFALEDSKELFEAIGGLNDDTGFDSAGMAQTEEPEYGVDDMLTVVPGSTDPFAGQSITTQQEPSDEEKRFVIDQFAEQMAKAHKTIVDKDAIDTFAPIIQDKVSMNVNQFLTDVQNAAAQRLSSQNVSDAQPSGANPDESLALADQQQQGADMGAPAMEPAPGGIAPEPSLDANVGDSMGMDGAQTDDLGLDGIAPMDDGFGDFGADEPAPEGGDDLGLDDITDVDAEGDLGGDELGGEDAGAEGDLGGDELGLDGISDMDAEGGDDIGAGEGDGELGAGDDDVLGGDSNLSSLDDEQFDGGDDTDGLTPPDDTSDADFEAEMAMNKAILESIHAKYVEDTARENVRNLVESFVRNNKLAKAQVEAAQKEECKDPEECDKKECDCKEDEKSEKANDGKAKEECGEECKVANDVKPDTQCQVESVAAAKRDELGNKLASMVESASKEKARAILENAAKAFVSASKRQAQKKQSKKLKATLESIASNYHAVAAKEKKAAKAMTESAKHTPQTLQEKLSRIVASVK